MELAASGVEHEYILKTHFFRTCPVYLILRTPSLSMLEVIIVVRGSQGVWRIIWILNDGRCRMVYWPNFNLLGEEDCEEGWPRIETEVIKCRIITPRMVFDHIREKRRASCHWLHQVMLSSRHLRPCSVSENGLVRSSLNTDMPLK